MPSNCFRPLRLRSVEKLAEVPANPPQANILHNQIHNGVAISRRVLERAQLKQI